MRLQAETTGGLSRWGVSLSAVNIPLLKGFKLQYDRILHIARVATENVKTRRDPETTYSTEDLNPSVWRHWPLISFRSSLGELRSD